MIYINIQKIRIQILQSKYLLQEVGRNLSKTFVYTLSNKFFELFVYINQINNCDHCYKFYNLQNNCSSLV